MINLGSPDSTSIPDVKKYLDESEYKLYNLIWKRTVASQMIDATYKQVGIDFLLSDKYKFKYKIIK